MQASDNQISKKKILITASTFPRYAGDPEPRFILDYAKSLQEICDVTVLVPADPAARMEEELEGVHVERFHYFPIHRWETLCYPGAILPRIKQRKIRIVLVPFLFLGLYRALRKRRHAYDAVHANWLIPQGIVQSFTGMPYVLTGHGGDIASLNDVLFRTLKRRCIRRAQAVTCVSQALKDRAVALFPKSEQADIARKITVLPFGCNVGRFGRQHRVENLWRQKDSRVVLFVGRLAEKKGVRYLIEAMQNVDAKLVIVGDGPLKRELRMQVKDLKLQNKVIFIGAKNHDQLPVIYASADVFAAPSVTAGDGDVEGFGLVIIEAMASGLPVVATKSGGITEVIRDGYNGLLAEEKNVEQLAECINRLLADDDLRERLIVNGEKTAGQHDYGVVGSAYAKLFGFGGGAGVSN